MESINALLKEIPQKRPFEEVMKEVYSNDGVKEFIEKYKDYIDEDMLLTGSSVLLEYTRMFNDEHYIPTLMLYANQIAITYQPRDTPLNLKYRDKVSSRLILDKSTQKYKTARLEDFDTNMENAKAKGIVDNFIANYQYGDNSKGMWLVGKFGIGKTYLMGGLANALHKRSVGVNFISVNQLMNDLYETIRQNSRDTSVQKQIEYLQKAEVLILDDIGTEKITRNNIVDVLYAILKYRGEYRKPTFITSNLTKDQYYTLIHSKTQDISRVDISRLKEQLDVLMPEVQMSGQNRRDKA